MSSKIKTSGGIVIKNDKILFIRKNNRWDLPKGKLEEGVNSRDTAIVEISEETGLKYKRPGDFKKINTYSLSQESRRCDHCKKDILVFS